ncbi:VCBS domain-containing protein [Vibrio mexicanus]|uniref:VCBS domain-containing protein n=1 Tax=Vibrio mexicanus TaxID=1004326 RepID=UPI00063CDA51|nr:VCBS domain-containing protein [Vibrio mexicanus]
MGIKVATTVLLVNGTIIIDENGDVRQLGPGETVAPGQVVVSVGEPTEGALGAESLNIEAELFTEDAGLQSLDIDAELAQIFEQIEDGVDPTLNEDFATAAGGQNGSSLTGSGDIERTGAETLAETSFDTEGLESQGLSETQSLALVDTLEEAIVVTLALISGDDNVTADETDEPLVLEGVLTATDTDEPTFVEQVDTEGENGQFSIDSDGNWVFVANSAFDELNVGDTLTDVFEVESDDGTISTVTVNINGTNDAPELSSNDGVQYSFEYAEGTEAGSVIGQVTATDPDTEILEFSITTNVTDDDDNELFQIDPTTGEISLTEAGALAFTNDFEQLLNQHAITVTVTEVGTEGEPLTDSVIVNLSELNIDDNDPIFVDDDDEPVEGYAFEYNENSTINDVIGTVSASDADDEVVLYSISSNVYGNGDTELEFPYFAIDVTSGEITLTEAGVEAFTNDYELDANNHSITVTATEVPGLGEIKNTDIEVSLAELNLDDNVPVFEDDDGNPVQDYTFEYEENSTVNDVIGTVIAEDPDLEDVTYSIETNVYAPDDETESEPLFAIDENSGAITLTAAGVEAYTNDFEWLGNMHAITVRATEVEGLGDVQFTDITVNLNEINLDDNVPVFEDDDGNPVQDYTFEYEENSTVNDVLGTVIAEDPDLEDVTYSIETNVYAPDDETESEPLFAIDENSGAITLTAAGVEAYTNDFEWLGNMHEITVRATEVEGLGDVQFTDITVNLNEINLDDNVPVFEDDDGNPVQDYTFEYEENSTVNDVIGTVIAEDPDLEDVTYSIETNVYAPDDETESEPLFAIDENSGAITLTAAGVEAYTNDFEWLGNMHAITVRATEVEGLGDVQFTDITVNLNEINLDDNVPVFEDDDGNPVQDYTFEYEENSTVNDVIGTVIAEDPDLEDVTYSIETNVYAPDDETESEPLFAIDENSGAITLTAAGVEAYTNDFEWLGNMHEITVRATEVEGLGDVQFTDITVNLNEINLDDNVPVFEDDDGNPVQDYTFEYEENSLTTDVLGTVTAVDPDLEDVTYSIETNVYAPEDTEKIKPLFAINALTGAITLTADGVLAFTNDFEWQGNEHEITVRATEVEGLGDVQFTDITVNLNELNLDDNAPEFTQPNGYEFSYFENSNDEHVIGQVSASDADGEEITYSILTNVYAEGDVDELNPFFVIDSETGEIRLTEDGVNAFTNNFELPDNIHSLVVTATEVGQFGGESKSTNVNVDLSELNVNEAPEAESFEAYLRDPDSPIPIVFDSEDPEFDHIWDIDEAVPENNEVVMVMITSLPTQGTLYYTDEEGERRALTVDDLYTGGDTGTALDPSKIEYQQGEGNTFELGGIPENPELVEGFYNWGVAVGESGTVRQVTLANGAAILITLIDNNPQGNGNGIFGQYTSPDNHIGFGLAENHGNGMTPGEKIIIDFSENPLEEVTLGIDGMQENFVNGSDILVTYTYQDGTEATVTYNKDSELGSQLFYEQFSHSSEGNPIVGISMEGTGGNWVLRDISGEEAITTDDTFNFVAVDASGLTSDDATVTIPPYIEQAAALGDETLVGTEDTDAFKWLQAAMDGGEDTVEDFTRFEDIIDITDVLSDDENVDIDDLLAVTSASIDGDDIALNIVTDDVSQTIVIDDGKTIFADYISPGDALDDINLMAEILKTDAA